jgi:hypothetical protein
MNPVSVSRLLAAGSLAIALSTAAAASASAAETPAAPRTEKPVKPEKPDKTDRPAKPDKTEKAERNRDREPSAPSSRPSSSAARSTTGNSVPAATVAPAGSFESFSLIAERNIFNPNRIGRTRANPDAPAPRTDQIALVGTVERGSSLVAVFDGSDPVWRKSLAVGDSIGDFKVVRITSAGADLERDGKPVSLLVSHALRRPEGGDWTVAKPPADVPPAGGLIGPRPGDTSAAPAEIPANASEVLKRLMKQREQQLKK